MTCGAPFSAHRSFVRGESQRPVVCVREIALHILDLLQNAVEAGATRVTLLVEEDQVADLLRIHVGDNGRGVDPASRQRVLDPFFTTRGTRHVGLGLPLLSAATERAGGTLNVESQAGAGTIVEATFRLSHPDRQPLGNLADTLLAILLVSHGPDLNYAHCIRPAEGGAGRSFEFDTSDFRAVLGDLPLAHPSVREWLADYLAEGEAALVA